MSLSTIRLTTVTPIGRDQQKKLTQILNNLIDLPESIQFLHPVSWKEMQLDDYLHVIKHPMNLYKVQQKMKNRDFNNVEEALDHIQLIWDNCKQYNKEGMYFQLAQKMEKAFKKMIKNYLPNIQLTTQPRINTVIPPPQSIRKVVQRQNLLPIRSAQNKPGFNKQPQLQQYNEQSKSQKQVSQDRQQVEQIPLSQKNRFHQRLKLITQQQLTQIVTIIQQNNSEGFKHISGSKYQIIMDNIDSQTFKKLTEKVDDFIDNQKINITGNKKVKV